ncbi:hypothetical protein TNCV_3170451 [Trichonephila clavipes]|nr:hypothetical protein TNCV_3170451 [Trichonephila clavipes]
MHFAIETLFYEENREMLKVPGKSSLYRKIRNIEAPYLEAIPQQNSLTRESVDRRKNEIFVMVSVCKVLTVAVTRNWRCCVKCRLEKKTRFLRNPSFTPRFFVWIDSSDYDSNRFKNRSFSERIAIPSLGSVFPLAWCGSLERCRLFVICPRIEITRVSVFKVSKVMTHYNGTIHQRVINCSSVDWKSLRECLGLVPIGRKCMHYSAIADNKLVTLTSLVKMGTPQQ